MRPGLVFICLFTVLISIYVLLLESLGTLGTLLLQAAIVFVVLAGAIWFRYTRSRRSLLFFGDEQEAEKGTPLASPASDDSIDELGKAR